VHRLQCGDQFPGGQRLGEVAVGTLFAGALDKSG
jgi:hypothetical protein